MTRRTESSARRPPGEAPVAPDEKDADWGFEQSDDEKLIEPKLGIALVGILLLAFGFVLYQKYSSIQLEGKTVLAGDMPPAEGDQANPVIHPSKDGESTDSPTMAESKPTVAVANYQGGIQDPFSDRESKPNSSTDATAESAAETGSPFAAAEPNDHADPFAAAGEPTQATAAPARGSAGPEPDPFAVSGEKEFYEPTQRSAADNTGAETFENADPFFGGQAPPPQSEPTIALDEEAPAGDAAMRPAPMSEWNLGQTEPDVASSAAAAPDPFATEAEPQDESTDWSPAPAQTHEEQSFGSSELAMPVPPQTGEPDPFSQSPLPTEPELNAEPKGSAEPNPFGSADVAQSPVGQLPPADTSEPSDWPAFGASESESESTGSSTLTSAPELPMLAAPPTEESGNEEFVADNAPSDSSDPSGQSTTHNEPPALEVPYSPDGNATGSDFATAAAPSSVVGERLVTVKRNDSLWSISQKVYGTARYVPALARYNRDRVPSPDKLKVGEHLLVPPPEVLEDQFPEMFRSAVRRDSAVSPAGGSLTSPSVSAQSELLLDESGRPFYRVGKSDTLSRIAQRFLGRGSRWKEILAMNTDRLKSPETLKPGMLLRLPAEAAGVALAPAGASIR